MEDSDPPIYQNENRDLWKIWNRKLDLTTKSGEPLARVNHGCFHPIRDRCIVN